MSLVSLNSAIEKLDSNPLGLTNGIPNTDISCWLKELKYLRNKYPNEPRDNPYLFFLNSNTFENSKI